MSSLVVNFDIVEQFKYLKQKHLTVPDNSQRFLDRVQLMYDLSITRYFEDYGFKLTPSQFCISDMIDSENEQLIEIYADGDKHLEDNLKILYSVEVGADMPNSVREALRTLDLVFAEPINNETYIGVVARDKTLYDISEQSHIFKWEWLYE